MSPARPAVFVGYANVDLVARVPALPRDGDRVTAESIEAAFGGMAANAACAAALAGATARFFGAVGHDPYGELVLEDLAARGVDTTLTGRDAARTSKALILVAPGGERAIVSEPVRYDGAALRGYLQERAGPAGVIYTDGYHLIRAREELALARERGFSVYCDLDGAPDTYPREAIWSALDVLDVVQWNPKVARAMTLEAGDEAGEAEPDDEGDPAANEAADARLASRVPVVLRTAGDRPVVVISRGERTEVPVEAVEDIEDTTGAGDAFAGTVIAALARGSSLLPAVREAIVATRAVLRVRGARAPRT